VPVRGVLLANARMAKALAGVGPAAALRWQSLKSTF